MSTDLFKKYQPEPMIKPKPNGFGPRLHNRAPATSMIDVEIEISLQSPVPLQSEEAYQEMASGKFKEFVVPYDAHASQVNILIEGLREIPRYKANSGPGRNPVKIFCE